MELTLVTTMRDCDSEEMVLKNVVLGHDPLVLIELRDTDGETFIEFNLDSTGFEDYEELADILEGIVHCLRNGDK